MKKTKSPKRSPNNLENLNTPGFLYLNEDMIDAAKQFGDIEGKGTVDELGFGALFGRISDSLFPWCSTLTSRARYIFYSAALLDIAADNIRSGLKGGIYHDHEEAEHFATLKKDKYMSEILKIEKQIAFTLFSKHPSSSQGIFGVRRVRRFCDNNIKVRGSSKILSANGRYPNAIYRGSCKSLRVFPSKSSNNTSILYHKILGHQVLTPEWNLAIHNTRSEVKSIINYWTTAEDKELSIAEGIDALKISSRFNNIRGFNLSHEEAIFLYSQIQKSTPYWQIVNPKNLNKVVTPEGINLHELGKMMKSELDSNMISAAHHINRATSPFINTYNHRIESAENVIGKPLPAKEIRESIAWLNKNSQVHSNETPWGQIWEVGYSDLLEGWLSILGKSSKVNQALLNSLDHRAEEVVQNRNKLAPHQLQTRKTTSREDTDIRVELEPDVSGYRLQNAARVLQDIIQGMNNVPS